MAQPATAEEWRLQLEGACRNGVPNPGSPEAQTLLAFRQVSSRLELCKYILQASFPHCQGACFQAACTLREMIQKEWSTASEDELVRLKDSLVQFAVDHVDTMENYLTNAIAFIVAVMVKRQWPCSPFVEQLAHQSAAACTASLKIMHAVLTEFDFECSTPLGLSLQHHLDCRWSFEQTHLPSIYNNLLQLLQRVTQHQLQCTYPERVVALCLSSIDLIVGWHSPQRADRHLFQSHQPIQALFDTAVLSWLFSLHQQLAPQITLAVPVRKLLTQFASVGSDDFDDDENRANFVAVVLSGMMPWFDTDWVAASDACDIFVRLARNFGSKVMLSRESSCKGLQSLANFCVRCVQSTKPDDEDDRIACFELALDGWLALSRSLNETTTPVLLQLGCAQAIFDAFVAKQLLDAADDNSEEECEGEVVARDQLLMTMGVLAGVCMEHSLRVLQQPFAMAFNKIQSGVADTVVLESLHSLLLLFGHVLVNTNESFDNEITFSIAPSAATIVETVVQTLHGVFSFVEVICQILQNESHKETLVSPRLIEVLLWLSEILSKTYLTSPASLCENPRWAQLMSRVHRTAGGAAYVLCVAEFGFRALFAWRTEVQVHQCASGLLMSLVSHGCASQLHGTGVWAQVVALCTTDGGKAMWEGLDLRVQALVLRLLCQGAASDDERDGILQPVTALVSSMLPQLASQPSSAQLERMLHLLGAVAQGAPHREQLPQVLGQIVPNLATVVQIYHADSQVVLEALALVKHVMQRHLSSLSPPNATALLQSAISVLRTHMQNNKTATSSSVRLETDLEELEALLVIVDAIRWNMIFFDDEASAENALSAVWAGLETAIQLLSPEVSAIPSCKQPLTRWLQKLKVPELQRKYLDLMLQMVEEYPQRVFSVPPAVAMALVSTLQFALLQSHSHERRNDALNAIISIAEYTVENNSDRNMIGHFLRQVLQLQLSAEYSSDFAVNKAGAALYALIKADLGQTHWQQLVQEILTMHLSKPDSHDQVARAISSLHGRIAGCRHKHEFSELWAMFLAQTRGLIVMK